MFDLLWGAASVSESLILVLILGILFLALVPLLIKWLWNNTLPDLFGFKKIRYWQSFRLYLLLAILLGHTAFFNFNQQTQTSTTSTVEVDGRTTSVTNTDNTSYGFGGSR